MKKLFSATSKKVLLATSVLAISSTAMANTSNTMDDQTLVKDSLSVVAKYITPITVALDLTEINFGDVWTDSDVTVTSVTAAVNGELDETFSYKIATTTNGNSGLVMLGGIPLENNGVVFSAAENTATELTFTVDLDTLKLTADTDVDETITFTVFYDAIANTSSSANGDYSVPTPNSV
jgi:hypothetical protein